MLWDLGKRSRKGRVEEEHLRTHWDSSAWCEVQRNGREFCPQICTERGANLGGAKTCERKSLKGINPREGCWPGRD